MDCESSLVTLENQIGNLEEEKLKLEQRELYSDADNVAKKIESLKAKLRKKQLDVLKSSHFNERDLLEQNYVLIIINICMMMHF